MASANAILKHHISSSLITVKRHAMVLSFLKANLVLIKGGTSLSLRNTHTSNECAFRVITLCLLEKVSKYIFEKKHWSFVIRHNNQTLRYNRHDIRYFSHCAFKLTCHF